MRAGPVVSRGEARRRLLTKHGPSGEHYLMTRWRRTLNLALPIVGGMVSQNVMNLVDTAMLGTLGTTALASVGLAQFTAFTCGAFVIGLATGVQATSARWFGAGRSEEIAIPLNGGLLLVLVFGIPTSIALAYLAPFFFPLLTADPDVASSGTVYLQARLVGLVALGTNFVFRGYWNAVDRSKFYMRTIILMNVTNIILNWALIFGNLGFPAMGVRGAGIGTTIALYVGAIAYLLTAVRYARIGGFLARLPDWDTLLTLLRISVPAGVQHFFFAGGMMVFFWILGNIGTAELAAGHVLSHLLLLWLLITNGFGLAAASFVGNALGSGNVVEARSWGWYVMVFAMCLVGASALPAVFFPDAFLKLFLQDPAVLMLARLPLQLTAGTMAVEALGVVLMNAHLGAGHSHRVMVISLAMQWCLFLPVAFVLQSMWGFGLLVIWGANIVYRSLQSMLFLWSWYNGRWAQVKV